MSQIENKEAAKLKADIKEDTKSVFEKYLSISGWDVPENDEKGEPRAHRRRYARGAGRAKRLLIQF